MAPLLGHSSNGFKQRNDRNGGRLIESRTVKHFATTGISDVTIALTPIEGTRPESTKRANPTTAHYSRDNPASSLRGVMMVVLWFLFSIMWWRETLVLREPLTKQHEQ